MKGNKLGFITYEDKLLELKNYIETKISDIINSKYNKTLKEADESTSPDDILIYGQYHYNPINRFIYLDIVSKFEDESVYNDIISEFNKFIYEDERVNLFIVFPSTESSELDETVYSYWRNLNGEYEFLRDKRMHDFDKYNELMEYEFTKFDEYKHQMILLNYKYDKFKDSNNIPAGFDEYKDIYKLYFDRELYPIEDIIKFALMYYNEEE